MNKYNDNIRTLPSDVHNLFCFRIILICKVIFKTYFTVKVTYESLKIIVNDNPQFGASAFKQKRELQILWTHTHFTIRVER